MSLKMADVCVKDSIIYLKYCLSGVLYLVLSQILLFSFCDTYWFLSHLARLYFFLAYLLSILSNCANYANSGVLLGNLSTETDDRNKKSLMQLAFTTII